MKVLSTKFEKNVGLRGIGGCKTATVPSLTKHRKKYKQGLDKSF